MNNSLELDELDVSIHPLTGDVAPEMMSAAVVALIVVIFL